MSATLAKDVLAKRRPDLLAVPPPAAHRVFRGFLTRVEAESYLNCFPRDLSWLVANAHLHPRMYEKDVHVLAQMFIR